MTIPKASVKDEKYIVYNIEDIFLNLKYHKEQYVKAAHLLLDF